MKSYTTSGELLLVYMSEEVTENVLMYNGCIKMFQKN